MIQNRGVGFSFPPMGKVTKWLCIALGAASLIFSFSQRTAGFGIADLVFTVPAVLDLEVWRILTYAFVEGQPFGLNHQRAHSLSLRQLF